MCFVLFLQVIFNLMVKSGGFNSLGEYERHRARLRGRSAGLRINPQYAEVETDLYNPCVPGSRLGVTAAVLGGARS